MERFTQRSLRELEERPGAVAASQKYLIVINPVSRGGKATREGMWLIKQMRRMGIQHEAFITENEGHAESIVRRWRDDVDVVVAVGGDGTINEIVNGMLDQDGTCEKTLAVFPAGTADDYCHNMGIPRKDRDLALEILLSANDRRIDLIRCNNRFAIVQLGVGVDAEIAYQTLSHKKIRIPAYVAVGMRIVFKERFRNSNRILHIETDDKVLDGKFLIAVFGNAPLYARFVYWMPDAKMDDGYLNMSALRPMSPVPAWYLLMRSHNKDYQTDKVLREKSKRFLVELREDSYLQIDGEVYKYAAGEKLDISVARDAIKVRIPTVKPQSDPFENP